MKYDINEYSRPMTGGHFMCSENNPCRICTSLKIVYDNGFLLVKLKSSLRKCYGRHHDLVDRYGISVSQMTTDMYHLS